MTITVPQWALPLLLLVILMALLPVVTELDDQHMIGSAQRTMKRGLIIENKTDSKANEIALIQERINELLSPTSGVVELSRTGNIAYRHATEDDYTAQFFINSINLFVGSNGVKGECLRGDCVTIAQDGLISDEKRQFASIQIPTSNAEQGDRLIEYLRQYQSLSNQDAGIDTGINRKLKKWYDRL